MKNLLILFSILGIITICCKKEELPFKGFTDIIINTSNGLGVWSDDALDVVVNSSYVRIYHTKQSWVFFVNNGTSNIYISLNGKLYTLEPSDKLSLPLTL